MVLDDPEGAPNMVSLAENLTDAGERNTAIVIYNIDAQFEEHFAAHSAEFKVDAATERFYEMGRVYLTG